MKGNIDYPCLYNSSPNTPPLKSRSTVGAAIPTGLGSHISCVTRQYVTDTYGHYCWFIVSGQCDHVGSVSCAGVHIAATSVTNSLVV
eukprot:SAG25_NODE_8995_length_392_cov_2.709898_1_plen_86_part_01